VVVAVLLVLVVVFLPVEMVDQDLPLIF